jgi:apolipoprotein N-acyltransferase
MVRSSLWKAALVFPTFWVTCEHVNNLTSPHGTFPNMGYTQMDLLPLLQLALPLHRECVSTTSAVCIEET